MGVSGSGKTFVGRALAADLGWDFFDADDFHPPENITKMASGTPLTDTDREPWLAALRTLLLRIDGAATNAVLACSALRAKFRDNLRAGIDVRYVYLRAGRTLLTHRLDTRPGHFMKSDLLESQFAALEEPEDALVLDAGGEPSTLVARIRRELAV